MTILFKNAGANTQDRRLVLNFINTLVSACGALIGTSITDRVGRRTVWLYGTLASAGMLAVVTGGTSTSVSASRSIDQISQGALRNGALRVVTLQELTLRLLSSVSLHLCFTLLHLTVSGYVVLFGFVYSLAYTPLQALYPSECLAYNTR